MRKNENLFQNIGRIIKLIAGCCGFYVFKMHNEMKAIFQEVAEMKLKNHGKVEKSLLLQGKKGGTIIFTR